MLIPKIAELLVAINKMLAQSNISLQDFNIETYMDDQLLIENGDEDLTTNLANERFDYLSGYFTVDKSGPRDEYFKLFKRKVMDFFEYKEAKVIGIYIFDGQVVTRDTVWVEIPRTI